MKPNITKDSINTIKKSLAKKQTQEWKAQLNVELQGQQCISLKHVTRLMDVKHFGPLYVQKPFYPEGKAHPHLYVLHPPGGLVSGDDLSIVINAKDNAGVLITTPGAGKAYRARKSNHRQIQKVVLSAKNGSCVEWFPQESIIYNGANVQMDLQVFVSATSSFIGWEILCFGLPSANASFNEGVVNQCLQIFEYTETDENTLLYRDHLGVSAKDALLSSVIGFNRCPVMGYLVATLPLGKVVLMDALVDVMRDHLVSLGADNKVAVTMIGKNCICRYLGKCTSEAKYFFIEMWKLIRPVILERPVVIPRIWHT